jgi:SAM-dependent methyltransferase
MQDKVVKNWCRTPKHILRMHCLLDMLKDIEPVNFLEMGSGTGDFTKIFLDKGLSGTCYDPGDENRKILGRNLFSYANSVQIVDSLAEIEHKKYGSLLAFEVLEHIENDMEALRQWSKYLTEGGLLLLSVPAHMKKYSNEDRRVGHLRRYEKAALYDLVSNAGFGNIKISNYGYPLGNITRLMSMLFAGRYYEKDKSMSMKERSIKSGAERVGLLNRISFLFNEFTMAPFLLVQRFFYDSDLGDGYVLSATKRIM